MSLENAASTTRLSVDISSGKAAARRLSDSIERLPPLSSSPLSRRAEEAPLCSPRKASSSPTFERAVGLMHGRHTQDMHERHVAALRAICRESSDGFFLQDSGSIEVLLGGAARQLRAGRTEYEAPVCDVLRLLAKPMRSVRTSDDKRYEQSMAALIRTASSLLRVGVPSVSACAAQMLLQIVISPGSRPSSRNGSPIGASRTMLSATRAQQLVASSGALQNLVAVLAAPTEGGTESSLTLASLRALRQLSRHEANALQIVRAEHVGALLGLLSQPLGSPCLSLAVEVLWNALDAAEAETAALLGRPQGMAALTDLLGRACASSAEADKELRNEVLVVLSKLAQALDPSGRELLVSHGALPLALALITHDVRLFVAQAARGSPPFEAIERVSCTMNGVAAQLPPVPPASAEPIPSRLQFELIELAMHLMQVLTASAEDVSASMRELLLDIGRLTCALEAYLLPAVAHRWRPAETAELRRLAIALLCNLAPLMLSAEERLPVLEACLPFLHDKRHPELREGSLRLLIDCLKYEPSLATPLAEAGAVPALTSILSPPAALSPTVRATSARELTGSGATLCAASTQDVLILLSMLCDTVPGAAEEFGEEGGVSILLPYLMPRGPAMADKRLVIATVNCLWSAVAPCAPNMARFVERGGVALLLNCLHDAPFAPRAYMLSCIADVLANQEAAEQARGWHAPDGRSCFKLFLDLWREEEARLTGAAAADGVLPSIEHPLSLRRDGALASLNTSLKLSDMELDDEHGGMPEDMGAIGGEPQVISVRKLKRLSTGALNHFSSLDSIYDGEDGDAEEPGGRCAREGPELDGAALAMRTMTSLRIDGRFEGLGETAEAEQLAGHDLRAKLYASLAALGFAPADNESVEPVDVVLLEAIKAFASLCEAEAWHDVKEELMNGPARTHRPVSADLSRLNHTIDELNKSTGSVLARQQEIASRLLGGLTTAVEGELLASVRLRRDGPDGPSGRGGLGAPVFKQKMDAKARIAGMVANSHVSFEGPMPDSNDYATAAIETVKESLAPGETLRRDHATAVLREMAHITGQPSGAAEECLRRSSVLEDANVSLKADAEGVAVAISVLPKDAVLDETELRRLCIAMAAGA